MNATKQLDAQAILACDDRKIVPLDVPEWGGRVYLRTMSGTQRDQYDAHQIDDGDRDIETRYRNVRSRLCVRCLCTAGGELLFTEDQAIDLGRKSAAALDRIFEACKKLNRLSDEDVVELVGNSAGDPNAASGSDSPPSSA